MAIEADLINGSEKRKPARANGDYQGNSSTFTFLPELDEKTDIKLVSRVNMKQ